MSEENETEENTTNTPRVQQRIRKLSADKRDLAARVRELEDALAERDAAAKTYDSLAASLQEKEAQLTAMQRDHETERAIMARGILDEEGIQVAKMFHGRLGEEAPAIGEWLSGDSLPRAVSVYLSSNEPASTQSAPVSTAPTDDAPTAAPTNPVNANAGVQAGPQYDGKADLKAATTNIEYYRANRDQFLTKDGFLKS